MFDCNSLETNEMHPARVRCQATCLDRLGACNPDLSLIVTSQEQFTPVCLYGARDSFYSRDGLHAKIHRDISYCEAQNNYTVEEEKLPDTISSQSKTL